MPVKATSRAGAHPLSCQLLADGLQCALHLCLGWLLVPAATQPIEPVAKEPAATTTAAGAGCVLSKQACFRAM